MWLSDTRAVRHASGLGRPAQSVAVIEKHQEVHFRCIAHGYIEVVAAMQQSLCACPAPQHMPELAIRMLPGLTKRKRSLG